MIFVVWSYPRYGGLLAWILTLNKSLLCHCSKAVSMTIFFSHFTEHHVFFPETWKFSCVERYRPFWILWSSFYFRPKSLLFEITCRGNLCKKNAKERVCEFSDAPSTRHCPEPPPSCTYSCCAYSYSSLYILFLLVVQTLTPCIYCYPSYILSLLVVYILTPCINYYPSSYILLLNTTITSYILLLLVVHTLTPCCTYSYSGTFQTEHSC